MAERNPKPQGMSWLSPHLIVRDVKASLEFYEKAFGFKTQTTLADRDGNLTHAEMTHKDCTFMMGPESAEMGTKSPAALSGSPVSFYLYVDNVDEFFQKAKAAGAEVMMEPSDQFWGDRMCALRCPEGHQWTFAQNVADFDPEKAPK